jgi:hypothetical protein
VAHLVAASDSDGEPAANAALREFHDKLAALYAKIEEATDRASSGAEATGQADAERITRQMTGRSVAELENMSEAEQQAMAQQMIQKQLGGAGLGNMSLSQLQGLAGKSEAEITAAMTAGGATIGGLTMEEIQAMEKMTDAQKAAYMQQGDRMQRMQAAVPNAQQSRNVTAQARNAQAQAGVVAEMKRITDSWLEIDRVNERDAEETAAECAKISDRYQPQMAAIAARYFDGKVDATPEEIEAANVRHKNLMTAEATEIYTLQRNRITRQLGRIKTKMADVARYDQLMAQSMASGGLGATSQKIPSLGFEIAKEYLDTAGSI